MNSVYILIAISIVSTLLMAGFAFLWHVEFKYAARQKAQSVTLGIQRDKLNRENADLHEKLRTQESFYKLYVNENVELTDKIDTLTTLVKDLNAENETLQQAVSQAVIPVRPVRKPAKKEGASE